MRLWKTKHPRKGFQNFRQSCMLLTDWIEIHQLQLLVWPSDFLLVMLLGCDWWILIRSVNKTQDWQKFWRRFPRCFVFQSLVLTRAVVKAALPLSICNYSSMVGKGAWKGRYQKKATANFSPTFRIQTMASALALQCSKIAVLGLFQVSIEIGIYCYMVDISWPGLFFRTALMYASLLGLSITVEMLLKRGANPQLTDSNDHTGMLSI